MCVITAWDSTCSTPASSLGSSSVCTGPKSMTELASGWQSSNASCTGTVGGSGPRRPSTGARHSTSLWEGPMASVERAVEILLVEDSPHDMELTLHALS